MWPSRRSAWGFRGPGRPSHGRDRGFLAGGLRTPPIALCPSACRQARRVWHIVVDVGLGELDRLGDEVQHLRASCGPGPSGRIPRSGRAPSSPRDRRRVSARSNRHRGPGSGRGACRPGERHTERTERTEGVEGAEGSAPPPAGSHAECPGTPWTPGRGRADPPPGVDSWAGEHLSFPFSRCGWAQVSARAVSAGSRVWLSCGQRRAF